MRYIDNKLCLTYDEIVPEIISSDNFQILQSGQNITVIDGVNSSARFIPFETLVADIKDAIGKRYGDPYLYASKQLMESHVKPDPKAKVFFENYVLPTGNHLPNADLDAKGKPQNNYVKRYIKNAEWLNMIIELTGDKQMLKQTLHMPVMSFWDTVADLLKEQEVALPKSRRHLTAMIKAYESEGYEALIVDKKKFGNERSKKINRKTDP